MKNNKLSSHEMWKLVKTVLGNKHCSINLPKDINSTDFNIFFSSVCIDICESFKGKEITWRDPSSVHQFKFYYNKVQFVNNLLH